MAEREENQPAAAESEAGEDGTSVEIQEREEQSTASSATEAEPEVATSEADVPEGAGDAVAGRAEDEAGSDEVGAGSDGVGADAGEAEAASNEAEAASNEADAGVSGEGTAVGEGEAGGDSQAEMSAVPPVEAAAPVAPEPGAPTAEADVPEGAGDAVAGSAEAEADAGGVEPASGAADAQAGGADDADSPAAEGASGVGEASVADEPAAVVVPAEQLGSAGGDSSDVGGSEEAAEPAEPELAPGVSEAAATAPATTESGAPASTSDAEGEGVPAASAEGEDTTGAAGQGDEPAVGTAADAQAGGVDAGESPDAGAAGEGDAASAAPSEASTGPPSESVTEVGGSTEAPDASPFDLPEAPGAVGAAAPPTLEVSALELSAEADGTGAAAVTAEPPAPEVEKGEDEPAAPEVERGEDEPAAPDVSGNEDESIEAGPAAEPAQATAALADDTAASEVAEETAPAGVAPVEAKSDPRQVVVAPTEPKSDPRQVVIPSPGETVSTRETGAPPTLVPPGAPADRRAVDLGEEEARPRHAPPSVGPARRLPQPVVALVVVGFVVLVALAWVVDSALHSGQVHRNVSLAGQALGGTSEDSLGSVVAEVADEIASRPVHVVVDGEPVDADVTAADVGLALDQAAAEEAAMDAGRGSLVSRPFSWVGSLFSDRTVTPEYTVEETDLADSLGGLYSSGINDAEEVVLARNPAVELVEGEFTLVPGQAGTGLDIDQAAEDLVTAAGDTDDPFGEINLAIETSELAPAISDEEAQALVDEANSMTEAGLTVVAEEPEGSSTSEQTLSPEQLRGWITPVLDPVEAVVPEPEPEDEGGDDEGEGDAGSDAEPEPLSLLFDTDAADAAVEDLFADMGDEPTNATVRLSGNEMEVVPSQSGVACCEGDVGEQVWDVLTDGESTMTVEAEVVEPEYTTADVEDWGIVEPVAGSRGWQAGAEVEQGPRPGYTTWEVGTGDSGRAHNIGLMADTINGSVIPPGETWSINDHVGARECPPYHFAGAIVNGDHEDVCGGGTSQVATTLLNAAYFAGLDVTGQAHSEYFSRYPRGREATMGAPGTPLDVTITNDTDYGVYIQGARHGNEVTFTIWSTENMLVEDLGTTGAGTCVTVTNTRRRTFPDGRVETDEFTAFYRPGAGQFC